MDIEPCCWGDYSKFKDNKETLAALDDNFTNQIEEEPDSKISKMELFRLKMWRFLEDPGSSKGAKAFAIISMCLVILSIGVFCLETHELFQTEKKNAKSYNDTQRTLQCFCHRNMCSELIQVILKREKEPHQAMRYLDSISFGYFTFEYISRFVFSPGKLRFVKSPLNIIDILCLLPHFISIIIRQVNPDSSTSSVFKAFLALRVIRVLRIFKLMKHYSAFKILVYTIKVSSKELLLMVIFLFSGVLIFASVIYYIEKETFTSIPMGFWWALVTMTTVGYGDKVPKTEAGYIIGSLCVLCGVLTVAFTVPIVVNNFTLYYSHAQSRIKLPVCKRKELKLKIFKKSQNSLEYIRKTSKSSLLEKVVKEPPLSAATLDKHAVSADDTSVVSSALDCSVAAKRGEDVGKTPRDVRNINLAFVESTKGPQLDKMPSERIKTISETVPDHIMELPGTPMESEEDRHDLETRQLLTDLADAKEKLREERKRQLQKLNQRREAKLQQRIDGKTPRAAITPAAASHTSG